MFPFMKGRMSDYYDSFFRFSTLIPNSLIDCCLMQLVHNKERGPHWLTCLNQRPIFVQWMAGVYVKTNTKNTCV